jgi:hypothetical protein
MTRLPGVSSGSSTYCLSPFRHLRCLVLLRSSQEVERIVGTRKRSGRVEYEVKWKGFNEEENTWEPIENLRNSLETVEFYFKKHPKSKGKNEFESFRRMIDREGGSVRNEESLNYVSVEEGNNNKWKTQKKPLEDESCFGSE